MDTHISLSANLRDLDAEQFDAIVNADVRGTLDADTQKKLREPENAERWYSTLVHLKRNVEAQFASNAADRVAKQAECLTRGEKGRVEYLHFLAGQERWRAGALRFLHGLEDKISEARIHRSALHSEQHASTALLQRDMLMRELIDLRSGIIQHRKSVLADDDEEGDPDDALWSLVDMSSTAFKPGS